MSSTLERAAEQLDWRRDTTRVLSQNGYGTTLTMLANGQKFKKWEEVKGEIIQHPSLTSNHYTRVLVTSKSTPFKTQHAKIALDLGLTVEDSNLMPQQSFKSD